MSRLPAFDPQCEDCCDPTTPCRIHFYRERKPAPCAPMPPERASVRSTPDEAVTDVSR